MTLQGLFTGTKLMSREPNPNSVACAEGGKEKDVETE